jgi:LacI family transcriptional regulator
MARIGIRQVAAEAGVSVTTVSHVLNEVPHAQVREETRQRVLLAAQRLGYRANRAAQSLRTQRTKTLALVSDAIATTPYAGQLILGAQRAAQARGYTVLLFNTDYDPAVEEQELVALTEYQVDGVIYATMYHRVVSVPAVLAGTPLVLLDAESPDSDAPSVVPDELGGGRTATEELVANGHRRIGFVTNVDDVPATHGRLQGYRDALAAAGVDFDPELVAAAESETWGGYLAASSLLKLADRPTALFCYNDRMAMGAYRAAAELRLRIPEDLSVVGFDNQELITRGLFPELTSVALPHYDMGYWATETLTALLDEPEADHAPAPRPLLMPCPLVRRSSVRPL